jgi:peptide/nickel transport system substrate-binding protein
VAFSIRRIIDPNFKSPQLSQFDQIASAEASGPAKVTMKTKTPYPALFAQLVKLSIVPKAVVEKVGDQNSTSSRSAAALQAASLAEGRADRAGRQRRLLARQAALPGGHLPGRPGRRDARRRPAHRPRRRGAPARARRGGRHEGRRPAPGALVPTERIGYLFVNALAGPTTDVRVRRAIAHAIDKKGLIDALLQGFGNPVNVVLTPANFGYVPEIKGYEFDPARAKALIKEAKAEGAALSFLTSPAYDRRLVEAVQQMLQDVGLKVEIVALDHPTFLRRRQGNPEEAGSISLGRWSCACQDADGVIFPLFRSGGLWSKYANPAYDAEVDAARRVLDEKQRLEHYRKAFEILREDVPGVGLYQDFAIYGARKEVQWTPTPNEAFSVFDIKWGR